MAEHDLPVWVHPMRGPQFADYASEKESEDEVWFSFGWPYETSAAMTRLIYSGLFDELPRLKIITHHLGGMIPYFAGRIELGFRQIFDGTVDRNPVAEARGLKRPPIDYFHMLYADTALNGAASATRCGYDFFGAGRLVFASDAPFDPTRRPRTDQEDDCGRAGARDSATRSASASSPAMPARYSRFDDDRRQT